MNVLFEGVYEISAIAVVKQRALRLLQVHPLRAADALQLASALVATQEDVNKLTILCLDKQLSLAAAREGFRVNPGFGD
jgi:hypothetical protein